MPDKVVKPVLVSVVGPTAVGKTNLAINIAGEFKTEIISADSRQFYRELEIGTAKPSADELSAVRHHFINSHSINQLYSAGEYGRDAKKLLEELFSHNPIVVVVGGSSLYLKALWEGFDEIPEVSSSIREQLNREFNDSGLEKLLVELQREDPEYYSQVDQSNGQRVIRALEVIRGTGQKFSSFRKSRSEENFYENFKVGLNCEREVLFDKINKRMDLMIDEGLFEEAENLVAFKNHNALQTVGYSEIFDYLDDKYDRDEAVRLLKRNSRRYAKRQLTWFRRYDDITWFEPGQEKMIFDFIKDRLKSLVL